MEIIKSLDNKKIKSASKLLEKKHRDLEDKFLIEGEHLVIEAANTGYLIEVFQTEDYSKTFNVPTTITTYEVIKKLSTSKTPQKVIGIATKKKEQPLGDKIVLLDNVRNPGNLGTIIRSCVAFGVSTLILGDGCVDLYNEKVLRATEGMLFKLNIIKRNTKDCIKDLQKESYIILGTNVTKGDNIKTLPMYKKIALIMGNEGEGLSTDIQNMCNKLISIPMSQNCESLNVGVATSILLYELF